MKRFPAVLASAALFALAASPAPARAPSAADQGCLDWILLRFDKDREEGNKTGGVVDPVAAFAKGDLPLEGDTGWKAMFNNYIYSPTEKAGRKAEAAQAIGDRFRLEDDRCSKLEDDKRPAAQAALKAVKIQVCQATLNQKGMLSTNGVVLACVLKIQKSLLPAEKVTWKETDSLKARKKAYDDLTKWLK